MLQQGWKETLLGPRSPLDSASTLHIYAVNMLRNHDPVNKRTEQFDGVGVSLVAIKLLIKT